MNRPITPDIEQAVKILLPICQELGYQIYADGSVMTIDGQKIGVGCNSTYATVMEGIGYIFYRGYAEGFRPHPISKASEEAIKRYWVKKRQSEGSQEE
jgi:hypothetical protein